MATLALVLASVGAAIAKEIGTTALLFENVRVFDGTNTTLSPPSNVLVIGDKIAKVSREPVAAPHDVAVRRVAGDGRTLMPGLIDAHWHSMLVAPDMTTAYDTGRLAHCLREEARKSLRQSLRASSIRSRAWQMFDQARYRVAL